MAPETKQEPQSLRILALLSTLLVWWVFGPPGGIRIIQIRFFACYPVLCSSCVSSFSEFLPINLCEYMFFRPTCNVSTSVSKTGRVIIALTPRSVRPYGALCPLAMSKCAFRHKTLTGPFLGLCGRSACGASGCLAHGAALCPASVHQGRDFAREAPRQGKEYPAGAWAAVGPLGA